jgi:hypothetical protein
MLLHFKRNLLCMLLALAFLLSAFGLCYADSSGVQVSLTVPSAHQVYKPGDAVEISGTAQGLAEVSVAVRDAQSNLVFTAQPAVRQGVFTTGFTLASTAAEGQYSIYIGSLGSQLSICRFQVKSSGGAAVTLTQPAAGTAFKAGDLVRITGTARETGVVALVVRNSNNGRVYMAQPAIVNDSFNTQFTLADNAVGGTYTITVTADELGQAQTYQFSVSDSGGNTGGGGTGSGYLTISSGSSTLATFSRDDLEAMTQVKEIFSAINDWPQSLNVAAEGVSLRTLLNKAGVSGQVITINASDGYTMSFTWDELFNQTRYYFPDHQTTAGRVQVEPLLALKRVEGSADYGNMTEGDTPVLCYGQRAPTEQTLMGFVKCVNRIVVSSDSPGQWEVPTAQIIDPDTKQKTSTTGGDVKIGSKIVLQNQSGTKCKIYYTTDGSTPDLNSSIYNISGHVPSLNLPIEVNQAMTIKAKAIGRGKRDSQVLTVAFTVNGSEIGGGGGGSVPQQAVSEENIKKEEISLENGRKGEKLTLQAGVLADIEKGIQGSRLAVTSSADVDQVSTVIPAAVLQKAQEKGMSMGVNSLIGNYTLPLDALDLKAIAAGLGTKPEELSMNIVISKASKEVNNELAAGIQDGQSMLVAPVEFSIEIIAPGGKKVEYKSFGRTYVERELALDGDVDARRATGVVWSEANSKFLPVPTRFEIIDGKNRAIILNRTNSLYTVLQSNKTFSDIRGNWAQADIEMLAAKLLISGKTETAYEPDSNITRAEFATLLVRALGLGEGVLKEGQFKDVAAADWFAGSVAAAAKENIITGYEGSLFKPDNNITRQEMAAMLMRAARFISKNDTLSADEQDRQQLAQFKDQPEIASWAAGDVALAVKAGIIKGMPEGTFSPQAKADRAQSAVMLERFLTYVNFISTGQPVDQQTSDDADQTGGAQTE